MAQQHETITNRLVDIIARIKMERRSGELVVRRGEGRIIEEGTLVFVQGQITRASAGRRQGSDALNWLSTWGLTRYIFVPITSEMAISSPMPRVSSSSGTRVTNPRLPSTRVPVNTDRLESPVYPAAYDVPYVTIELDEATERIEQAGLSRAHRRIYLLIDGRRTAIELVPLSNKTPAAVRTILHDLEWLGIIRIASPPATRSE